MARSPRKPRSTKSRSGASGAAAKPGPGTEIEDAEVIDEQAAEVTDRDAKEEAAEGAPEETGAARSADRPDAPEGDAAAGDDAQDGGEAEKPEQPVSKSEDGQGGAAEQDAPEAAETAPARAAAVDAPPPPSRTGIGVAALLLGGVAAGLIGFMAARFLDANRTDEFTPEQNAAAIATQWAEINALKAELETRLDAIRPEEAAREAVAPVEAAQAEISARLDDLSAQVAEITERVETIAMRPVATGIGADEFDAALEEFRDVLNAAIADAQGEIAKAKDEAQRISAEAYDAEQAALLRGAWAQVSAALESGAPYAEPLGTVAGFIDAEIPEALSTAAADGLPTLADLQQGFPEAARAALNVAIRAEAGQTATDRFRAFLRVQTGARSLTPREGDDPDAILSRAEAALKGGDIAGALAELAALPEPGRGEMAAWEDRARLRLAALDAAAGLAARLTSN